MTIELRVNGTQELAEALRRYGEQAQQVVANAVQATALEVRGDIQRRIQRGPKTGRVYVRDGISHRASAPGEAPATDNGFLVGSIVYQITGTLSAKVESRLDYATYLEFGTVNIAPRPSWTPAVEQATTRLQERVRVGLERLSE